MESILSKAISFIFAIILLLFNIEQTIGQDAPVTLIVDVAQFNNPTGLTVSRQCCDGSSPPATCPTTSPCFLYTLVCLDFITSTAQANWTICPLGVTIFRVTVTSTNSVPFRSIPNVGAILPLEFPIPVVAGNSVAIKVFLFYDFLNIGNFTLFNQSALLSRFYTIFRTDASFPSANTGVFQRIVLPDVSRTEPNTNQLILNLMTYCQPTFFGSQCNIRCIPNNDCTSSYTCNSTTGAKVCSPGWYGIDCNLRNTTFVQPICSITGLTCNNGGFCQAFNNTNQPTCCCPSGFTGFNCQYLSTCIFNVTCLNGGLCRASYDPASRSFYYVCECPVGFTGLYCERRQQCPPNFYGPNCTVQCFGADSCSAGHYFCNTDGAKICLPGWGPVSTCLIKNISSSVDPDCPVPTGCMNGGSCFNRSCCCPPSFTGRLCETPINPCAINPCQNNGLCIPDATGYRCQCSIYYTGSLCEISLNPCDYSPCRNGGTCRLTGNLTSLFVCLCPTGFVGQFCEVQINFCASQPCLNGGICANTASGFQCICSNMFTGPTCAISLDPCVSGPCIANNTLNCVSNNFSYICVCRPGFTGPICSQTVRNCGSIPSPCRNGGTCVNTATGYFCQCTPSFQGIDCDIPVDPCSSNPCVASNSISCQITTNGTILGYNCTCRPGFSGTRCEISVNPCSSNPCSFGTCVPTTPNIWTCVCDPGWTGIQCKDGINECLSNPCQNAGVCIDGINSYRCVCLTGFTGANCQIQLNPCASTPCINNGTCINNASSYSCLCPPGFTGLTCDTDINECSASFICHPNSTCINTIGSYRCICPPWLTGLNCYQPIDLCVSRPCQNNGVCTQNYGGSITCRCQPGFTGLLCEININDCLPSPCLNNGICIDQVNSFLCLCPSGYTGLRCETTISQCLSSPCLNGGTCRDFYTPTGPAYICLCPPLYNGTRCEQMINPCASAPCIRGTCVPIVRNGTNTPAYFCQCVPGFTGINCEQPIDNCASAPCGPFGTCTSLINGFSCCCMPGYTGLLCNQLINLCLNSPCSTEGTSQCFSTGPNVFSCSCQPGYTGRFCEVNIDECASQPCFSGGTCIDLTNGYRCNCPIGFSGTNCLRLQDQCSGINCLNGGRCIRNGTRQICLCPQGYQGENCELLIDSCRSQPCQHGGLCLNSNSGPQCSCPSGITGSMCETIINQCQSMPCQNSGTCHNLINHYACICPSGFMGSRCETERNECEPVSPCLNSGRCIDRLNNFSCLCNPGFTGAYCEIQIDHCQSNPCNNGAICRTLINSYRCDCPQGYNGTQCNSIINHCISNPCQNNALCIPLINGYRCVCLEDYLGVNCEKKSNECSSMPCLNGGTCNDGVWNYSCQCPSGFTGSNCHKLIDYCASSPCINGMCKNTPNGYVCACLSSSFTGKNCEIQLNKCASSPCMPNATCIDGLYRYVCLCPPWFSGATCSEPINPCSTHSKCANNATCLVNYSAKPYGYTCQCLPGFTGQMCEINIDDCANQPCRRGRCIDGVNGFTCSCYSGNNGPLCANEENPCLSAPCRNNGVCMNLVTAYQCRCANGFQGINCEQPITQPCSSSPCLNNGTCTIVSNNGAFQCACLLGYTGPRCELTINACTSNPCRFGTCQQLRPGFYSCQCSPGYTDFNCQTDINECASQPCLNNGSCVDLINQFNCICPSGFSGAQCQLGGFQCNSGPCLNNATCLITSTGYQCACPPGLTGTRCEIDINECASSPCQNGGICLQPSLNRYQCLCPTSFTGINCESILDPCASLTCLNNGSCIRTSSSTATCSCVPPFTGLSCENQINSCASAPCVNGTCIPAINAFQCFCFPGYTGVRCDILINACQQNPCLNNGTCMNQLSSFVCQCAPGFQGLTCAIRVQACQSSPCLNGGTCIDTAPGIATCNCPPPYRGPFCQLRDPFCAQAPCQNNGICQETLNGYLCICQGGFTGVNCTDRIQPCLSNPCLNGGICTNIINGLGYQCTCPTGYAGLRCETLINWCTSSPCLNQGTCIPQTTGFQCICPPSFTGIICQTSTNSCASLNCGYGYPVSLSPTVCSCICGTGYTGSNCQAPINPCLSSLNNTSYCIRGSCNYVRPGLANCFCPNTFTGLRCNARISDGACASCPCVYGQCQPVDENNTYLCICNPGYTGQRCEISINLCTPSPCVYGQCILDPLLGYRCICAPGATGRNCSILIDACTSRPCQNNGVCVPGLNTYQCLCTPGYAGINCEILINQCTSLICYNNGTCVNLPTLPPSAQCQCLPGFTGLQCQYSSGPCASQPCRNLGTCYVQGTSYICSCPPGFIGVNCEIRQIVCASRPCLNGGTCLEPNSNYYICQCQWPFYGVNCQLACDPCASFPCRGPLSQCVSSPIYLNYTCICPPGFWGPTCSSLADPCSSSPCLNNGICVRTSISTFSCACQPGYNGTFCETKLNPCLPYPCVVGTSIVTSPTTCQCQCPLPNTGAWCQINVCQNNPCTIGTCIPTGNFTYTCTCPPGFQFLMGVCADINECTTIPGICANGARCLNSYGSYICFCNPGFYGNNCELYDPCRSSPCVNGGTCATMASFPFWQCLCPGLFTGPRCETTSLGCLSNPCRTGTCTPLPNGAYQCACPPAATGINCEIPLLPCASNPCQNNATCLTISLTNYTCICPPLFTGPTCSQRIFVCTTNPCQGNSTCIVDPITGIQTCRCPPGRYGINCEIISPCGTAPCIRGTCQNRNASSYECVCEPGFTGTNCDVPFDVCQLRPCLNGGTCNNRSNGIYSCQCLPSFTGINCEIPLCTADACFNGGTCLSQNNSIRCSCSCGFTGSRCETPFDICATVNCQNNGTRTINATSCQCTCLCPSSFTGNSCELMTTPVNRTFPGQIVIPVDRPGGSSWEIISQCVDQVWNNINSLLICNSPFTLVTPTSFYPYCYQLNQQASLINQQNAFQDCTDKSSQLVWFQSVDELQQQLVPTLFARGLARDFWTSGLFNPTTNRWQWLLATNNTRVDIDQSIVNQFQFNPTVGQSIYYSFAPATSRRLVTTPSSGTFSTLCKIAATRLPLNNETRSILLSSQQFSYQNQSQVIVYNFNYTIFSNIPSNMPIAQPTSAQYAALCGAISRPSNPVDPYSIDICGFFPTVNDGNVRVLMQAISSYYTARRITLISAQNYLAVPLAVEHFATITGDLMTRIRFIITSGSSIVLGANVEPLAPLNDILRTIDFRIYQQCIPYISTNILLPLKMCIPMNEISSWTNLVANAVATATGQNNVLVMLKAVQPGITLNGFPAHTAYFLITINSMTYNDTSINNLATNPLLLAAINQANSRLLCSNGTIITPYQNSIQDFHVPCPVPQILQRTLNNALLQAGIFDMNFSITDIDEAVDNTGQIYRLPTIFIRHQNGTWLDAPLQLNAQLYQVLLAAQMQRIVTPLYRLSRAYSYFYGNRLTINDREYLERLVLTIYNRQNSISGNQARVLLEDPYLNLTSPMMMTTVQRVYVFVFYNDQLLDGRYLMSIILAPSQFVGPFFIQSPLTFISNLLSMGLVKQRDVQQIAFTGRVSRMIVQSGLTDYWQNPIRQGLTNALVTVIEFEQYFVYSISRYYTRITYMVITADGFTVPSACFNPTLMQPLNGLCDAPNNYILNIPMSESSSFIDLRGNYLQTDLIQDNFASLITSALQRTGFSITVSSITTEGRFGFDISLITRVHYTTLPNQRIPQEQIQNQLRIIFSTSLPLKYELYPGGQLSVARNDAHQYIANVSIPLSTTVRQEIENFLTSFNRQYGVARIVYFESLNAYQTRFYLVFLNATQILTRCDFFLFYPGVGTSPNGTGGFFSLFLDRSIYVAQPNALVDGLTRLWQNQNPTVPPGMLLIRLQSQMHYVCSQGQRSVRVDYIVQSLSTNINVNNLTPPPNSAFDQLYGNFVNTSRCIPYQSHRIFFTEPRPSNELIRSALESVWRLTNNGLLINVSPEFYFDTSYVTPANQSVTRVTYTVNLNGSDVSSLIVNPPSSSSIPLSNVYANTPCKRYSIYVDGSSVNTTSPTTMNMINQAIRKSWAMSNSYLFSPDDVAIASIFPNLLGNGQNRLDYLAGIRGKDIGDYLPPSERIYSQVFNQTGLPSLVYTRYIPQWMSPNSDNIANSKGPFYYPVSFLNDLSWWIILIIVVGIITLFLVLFLLCYACFRWRAEKKSRVAVVQSDPQQSQGKNIYGTRALPTAWLSEGRRKSISIVDAGNGATPDEFHRPKRTTRSVSPSGSFRYILPFNSHREQKRRNIQQGSVERRQEIPMKVSDSPVYTTSEYF